MGERRIFEINQLWPGSRRKFPPPGDLSCRASLYAKAVASPYTVTTAAAAGHREGRWQRRRGWRQRGMQQVGTTRVARVTRVTMPDRLGRYFDMLREST